MGVAIAFYAFIAIGIAEAGLGVLLPSILSTYQLNAATVTLLFFSQITGYIIAAITSGIVISRLGLARMLFLAAVTLTLALIVYAVSPSWALMVITGSVLGLGIGLIDAGINTYIVQDARSAHLIGLLHGFYGIGALSGPAVATTLLAIGLNWRQVYFAFAGVVGLLAVGLLIILLYRTGIMSVPTPTASAPMGLATLKRSLTTPVVLLTGLLLLVYVGTEASVGNWAYTVQFVARQTPELTAGYSVSAYWLGLTVGRFSLSYVLHHLGADRIITLSLTLLLLSLLAWCFFPKVWISLPLIGFALSAIFPATIWLIPYRVAPPLIPATVGFATSMGSLGAAIVPSALGWCARWAGLNTIPFLLLPLALVMFGIHRWLRSLNVHAMMRA